MEISEEQKGILNHTGHTLVMGGPGSGKTTVAIFKAANIAGESLCSEQKVLFLSFARATIARILEAIEEEKSVDRIAKKSIEVDTYHSFFWKVLRGHGYLIGLPKNLEVLTPSDVSATLSQLRTETDQSRDDGLLELTDDEHQQLLKIARDDGKIAFDLFAPLLVELFENFPRIRKLVSTRYPFIILDEFQDTTGDQWRIIQSLKEDCVIIALADPEQRIFDFIDTDPERANQFVQEFETEKFDLGGQNHRSGNTEIAEFGNDILRGTFGKTTYNGVTIKSYDQGDNNAHSKLLGEILASRKRIEDLQIPGWSIGVLVPTKQMTREVSDVLRAGCGRLPPILHTAITEKDAAILASHCIGFSLQQLETNAGFEFFANLVCQFLRGKSGASPSATNIKTSVAIVGALAERKALLLKGKDLRSNSIVRKMEKVYFDVCSLSLTGDPKLDWLLVRDVFEKGTCARLKNVAEESRNLRLLERGRWTRLSQSEDWSSYAGYPNALALTKSAFVQDYFATSSKPEVGVIVMNLHKAKGKQFDETVMFEGWPRFARGVGMVSNKGRYIPRNTDSGNIRQYRQNFRMAATRSKQNTTILTPQRDISILLDGVNID